MRKIILWNVLTLDGHFEGEKPWDLSFHALVWGPELEALSLEQLQEADMLIFGKNTYQGMADYWPKAKEKEAALMNNIAKVVCSSSLKKAGWNNTTIIRDAVPELMRLKEQGDKPKFGARHVPDTDSTCDSTCQCFDLPVLCLLLNRRGFEFRSLGGAEK